VQLGQLANVCKFMARSMEEIDDPCAVEFAHMTRDQLFSECGLFDPQCDDPMFLPEKQLLLLLVSHVDALQWVLENYMEMVLTDFENASFNKLIERCSVCASVIEYHLLISMIVYNATSDSDAPTARLDDTITLGRLSGSEEKSAKYDLLCYTWSDPFSADRIIEDVKELLSRTALSGHRSENPV